MSEKSSEDENFKKMEIEQEEEKNKNSKKFNFKPIKERETSRFLTKFERAKILGERAIQISNGAKVMVEVEKGVWDPMIIAEKELREKKINYVIRRYLPDGNYEDWNLNELIFDKIINIFYTRYINKYFLLLNIL